MVKSDKFIPKCGDIVWINFDPQSGHEQSGRRPALVLSPQKYNEKVGLAIFCTITKYIKGYPELRFGNEIGCETLFRVL